MQSRTRPLLAVALVATAILSLDPARAQVPNQNPDVNAAPILTHMSCNLRSDTQSVTSPSIAKPGYLKSYTEPVFGTKVTRITGDPGTAIASGGMWGTDVHNEYSKVQAWNADQSLIYIETNRDNGGTGSVFLDGNTYQPKFSARCPGNECRWHPLDPTSTIYAGKGVVGYWFPQTNTKMVIQSFPGYGELYIGPWEGNLSLDGSIIVLSGTAPDGTEVAFAYDLVRRIKYPDIKVLNFGNTLDWASISPKGGYVVMSFSEDDHTAITDLQGNLVTSFSAGHPSHDDMTVDANGDEVAVGKAVSFPYGGMIVKVRLKDGAITKLTTGGYGRHSSTRDTTFRFAAVSSFEPDAAPYKGEIALVNLDGSAVYRLAHHYTVVTDYEAEAIPTISPDGTRVIFSSNWGASSARPVQVYVIDLRGVCTPSP